MVPPPAERTHPPNSKAAEIHVKIILLNKVILHGGSADVDAMMLEERQPILIRNRFNVCTAGP